MLDVVYEDVVDDLEGQARRLIAYCGLPWDDRCLSFHTTSRPVKTASGVQVRKPLFRSSLQRWRKYEAGLAPLLEELGDIVSESGTRSEPGRGRIGYFFSVDSTAETRSFDCGSTAGSNRWITLPVRSTRNFVKFH